MVKTWRAVNGGTMEEKYAELHLAFNMPARYARDARRIIESALRDLASEPGLAPVYGTELREAVSDDRLHERMHVIFSVRTAHRQSGLDCLGAIAETLIANCELEPGDPLDCKDGFTHVWSVSGLDRPHRAD
jgi:hypothetical protein